MARNITEDDIRSTTTQTYEILHGGESKATYVYVNDLDADLSISVEATYQSDENFNNAVTLLSGKTVGAGETAYDTTEYPWDRLRFSVTAGSTPTNGTLEIKKMV